MNNRALVPRLCKSLQVFTQNSVISAAAAGNIVSQYSMGNVEPLEELTSNKDIPVALLPVISEIKNLFLQGGKVC